MCGGGQGPKVRPGSLAGIVVVGMRLDGGRQRTDAGRRLTKKTGVFLAEAL